LSVAQVDVARQNVSRGILIVRKFPFLLGIRSTVQWVKLWKTNRLPTLAADLVQREVAVIAVGLHI
jgi:hypothetical protein